MAEENGRVILKSVLTRVVRAIVWGFIMGGELLIPMLLIPDVGEQFEIFFPGQIEFSYIVAIFIGFEVAIQLLRETIFQYALSMARALTSMILLVLATNGGVIAITMVASPNVPLPSGVTINLTVDFSTILGIFLILSLLSIIKNLLQAIDFLSRKAEEPKVLPELP